MESTRTAPGRTASPRRRVGDPWWLRVRWDRVGRVSLLACLAAVLLAYVGPAKTYFQTWQEAKQKRATVARLQRENRSLAAQQKALRDPRTLELDARRLGMVRPDERSYVILGLHR